MRRVLLVLGSRGQGLPETLAGVSAVADVVVAGISSVLESRHDRHALTGWDVVAAADARSLVRLLRREHPISGVVTFADDAITLASHVAAALEVRGIDPLRVGCFRDKLRQRRELTAAGFACPRYVRASAATLRGAVPLRFPVVVKPAQASGGALAFVVDTRDELTAVIAECTEARSMSSAVDDDTDFIVEELIVGAAGLGREGLAPYVSVETASVDGVHRHLTITDRFPLLPPVLETGMSLPSSIAPESGKQVVSVVHRALDALGMTQGMSHTEVMLGADGPVIIEVNARTGGAIPYLFPLVGGPDMFAAAARVALGEHIAPPRFSGTAAFVVLQHPMGVTVRDVGGFQEIGELPATQAVVEFPQVRTTTSLTDTMAGFAVGRTEGVQASVAFHRACYDLFRGHYADVETPPHYRRTPDGSVHKACQSARASQTASTSDSLLK